MLSVLSSFLALLREGAFIRLRSQQSELAFGRVYSESHPLCPADAFFAWSGYFQIG